MDIHKASLGESHDGKFTYSIANADRINEIFDIYKGFCSDENLSMSIGLASNKQAINELNDLIKESIVKDGVSIICIEKATNKIVAASVNLLQIKKVPVEKSFLQQYLEKKLKEPETIWLIEFLVKVDNLIDLFEKYGVTSILEIAFLATHQDYRGKGLATELVKRDTELMNHLSNQKNGPRLLVATFTSTFSYKAGLKLGFDSVTSINYKDIEYKGTKLSEKVDPIHEKITLMAKLANA